MINLKELLLADNKITKIERLFKLTNLKILDLSDNKGIKKIENTSFTGLINLEELNLSYC